MQQIAGLVLLAGAILAPQVPTVAQVDYNSTSSLYAESDYELDSTGQISTSTIADIIRLEFGDKGSLFENIAKCESGLRQFTSGYNVVENGSSSAIGVFQVMSSLHYEEAMSEGFDIYGLRGNIEYAHQLFLKDGTSDWQSSFSCWSRPEKSG